MKPKPCQTAVAFTTVEGRIHQLRGAKVILEFFSFDDRQRKAAASEGLKVKP